MMRWAIAKAQSRCISTRGAVAIEQDCFYQAMALQHWMHKDHGQIG
jgi:hypothetical protein